MASQDYLSWLMVQASPQALRECVAHARKCMLEAKDAEFTMFSYIDEMFKYVATEDCDVDQQLYLIYVALCVNMQFVDYIHARGVHHELLASFVRTCQSVLQHFLCGHELEDTHMFFQQDAGDRRLSDFRHVVSELRGLYHMMLM